MSVAEMFTYDKSGKTLIFNCRESFAEISMYTSLIQYVRARQYPTYKEYSGSHCSQVVKRNINEIELTGNFD